MSHTAVMPEGEKHWGGAVVICGDNLPSLVQIGLTDLPNIGGPVAPLAPGSGITLVSIYPFEPERSCAVHKSAF